MFESVNAAIQHVLDELKGAAWSRTAQASGKYEGVRVLAYGTSRSTRIEFDINCAGLTATQIDELGKLIDATFASDGMGGNDDVDGNEHLIFDLTP